MQTQVLAFTNRTGAPFYLDNGPAGPLAQTMVRSASHFSMDNYTVTSDREKLLAVARATFPDLDIVTAEYIPLPLAKRRERLMPGGIPKWVRIYKDFSDPKNNWDCWTVVFTGHFQNGLDVNSREWPYIGRSGRGATHYGHCPCDRPKSSHLGRKVNWELLRAECPELASAAIADYMAYWRLNLPEED